MATLADRTRAAMDAFRNPTIATPVGSRQPVIDQVGRYDFLWDFWYGRWTFAKALAETRKQYPDLYANTRQLWRHADAIVSLYEQFVYIGDLSTDGGPLPDGSLGAIPIDAQTGSEASDLALKRACGELWSMWNFRSQMSLRPKFAAILGDCLTELVEDPKRGTVMPRTVWPGYVTDLELDLVGNIKRYTLEYWVELPESRAYGIEQRAERYKFRKEVDGEAFRYFKDDRPDESKGAGGIVDNWYGFVPAVWDRFEQVWGNRGISAIERTMQQVLEMNSFLSHAWDYQQKSFAAPVGIIGNKAKSRTERAQAWRLQQEVNPEEAARELAESLDLMPMTAEGAFVTVKMDLGQAVDVIKLVMDSVIAETPEARYGQDILSMTQVTAPGIERALGTISGRLRRARASIDPQTVKMHQMAISMIGARLNEGDIPPEIVADRSSRYQAFAGYDLTSYGKGLLDFSIPDREWIPDTIDERLARLVIIESLQTRYALQRAGVEDGEIDIILGEREERQSRLDEQITGIRSGDNGDDEEDEETIVQE